MIVTKLVGGLGNQMFQYAAGRKLALLHNTELFLDTSEYVHVKNRHYALGNFRIKAKEYTGKKLKMRELYTLEKRILQFAPFLYDYIYPGFRLYKEKSFRFDKEVFTLPDGTYLSGYWQSYKYFEDIENTIREEFSLKKRSSQTLNTEEQITKEISVSLHIRRGDYISDETTNKYHGVISPEYYRKALKMISKRSGKVNVFIFSDDSDWVKKNLKISLPVTYVSGDGRFDDQEEMYLMSKCTHHIIANSSFSWWGAWLNRNERKIVIAPKRWFKKEGTDTADFLPRDWIRIDD